MAKNNGKSGAWVIKAGSDIYVESSEVAALRTAIRTGGKHEFVEYGASFDSKSATPQPQPEAGEEPAY